MNEYIINIFQTNLNKYGCGYYSVCSDHGCACKLWCTEYNEQIYNSLKKELEEELSYEDDYYEEIEDDEYNGSYESEDEEYEDQYYNDEEYMEV